MQRREFVQTGLGVAGSIGFVAEGAAAEGNQDPPPLLKPKRLRPGMTVGVVAPSSPAAEDETVRYGLELVESFGFRARPGKHLFERTQYLAGPDAARAADLNAMFADPEVGAIMALAGGYGAMRVLPYLDYDVIRSNPKALIGYSDITALHCALHRKCGLITYHGQTALSRFTNYSIGEFQKVLMEPKANIPIAAPPPFTPGPGRVERENRITSFRSGIARGRLTGGNLTLVTGLMGTPYEPDFSGRLVFLEDVHEKPYRVDRMLTQLLLSGKLAKASGLIFGKFTDAEDTGNTFSLEHVLRDAASHLDIPCARGLMIGHVPDQSVVPIGVEAEFDGSSGRLTLLESPMR
ncbi:MAG: LD-carboxypeptidase [Bryobacterales bacterium]|nr:LD-carboxypeptidase [Bryobacterales bacterium]